MPPLALFLPLQGSGPDAAETRRQSAESDRHILIPHGRRKANTKSWPEPPEVRHRERGTQDRHRKQRLVEAYSTRAVVRPAFVALLSLQLVATCACSAACSACLALVSGAAGEWSLRIIIHIFAPMPSGRASNARAYNEPGVSPLLTGARHQQRSGDPLTVRGVLERIDRAPPGLHDVMTMVDNVHRKGVLSRERQGRAWRFWPTEDRARHTAELVLELLSGEWRHLGRAVAVPRHRVRGRGREVEAGAR